MLYWSSYPFVRILLVFICGTLTASYVSSFDFLQIGLPLAAYIFVLVCLCKKVFRQISNKTWGNLLLANVFLIGVAHMNNNHNQNYRVQSAGNWSPIKAYVGTVSSFPVDKEKFIKYEIDTKSAIGDSVFAASIKILLYQKKNDSTTIDLRYGDKIRVEGQPVTIPAPKNPYEFDYRTYLIDQGIYYHHFAGTDQIRLETRGHGNPIMQFVYELRSKLARIIAFHITQHKEQAVVKALLLGIKGQLDSDTKSAYAAAGAMHVLAVSGLHVSVVCLLLQWFFKIVPAGRFQRVAAPICSILALWIYALLTGFSPSILRAATMFSIILFSKILNRRANVFNSLAFAAFVLLLYQPIFIFSVGFQLSFLAVAGILYIYPKLYALWQTPHWFGDKIWQLACVSLAAQLATFPLSLYYFHQFPTYFLLTNLVVIPASFAIMILGIALIIFGHRFPWIGWLLEHVAFAMNWFVELIQSLKGSAIDWVQISIIQTVLIYLLILTFVMLFSKKKTYFATIALLATLGIAMDRSVRLIVQSSKQQLLFYSTKNSLLVDQNLGLNAQLFSIDSAMDVKPFQYQIAPFRRTNLLPAPDTAIFIKTNMAEFAKIQVIQKKRILYLHKPIAAYEFTSPLVSDVVVVSNQALESLNQLVNRVNCKKVILDNTNGRWYVNKLKKEANNLDVKIIDLMNQSHTISLSGDKKFLDMFF